GWTDSRPWRDWAWPRLHPAPRPWRLHRRSRARLASGTAADRHRRACRIPSLLSSRCSRDARRAYSTSQCVCQSREEPRPLMPLIIADRLACFGPGFSNMRVVVFEKPNIGSGVNARQAVALHFLPQRRAGNPKRLGRRKNGAAGHLQRPLDVPLLGTLASRAERLQKSVLSCRVIHALGEEVAGHDPAAYSQGDGTLDPVSQLANVARPGMLARRLAGQ